MIDRYKVNDALDDLARTVLGLPLPDDVLDELTHHVADVLDDADRRKPGD